MMHKDITAENIAEFYKNAKYIQCLAHKTFHMPNLKKICIIHNHQKNPIQICIRDFNDTTWINVWQKGYDYSKFIS